MGFGEQMDADASSVCVCVCVCDEANALGAAHARAGSARNAVAFTCPHHAIRQDRTLRGPRDLRRGAGGEGGGGNRGGDGGEVR